MTISPVMYVERQKCFELGILKYIDEEVYICTCKVKSSDNNNNVYHTFFYERHLKKWLEKECCGSLVYNKSNAPICVLGDGDRVSKSKLKMHSGIFECHFIMDYVYKVSPKNSIIFKLFINGYI